MKDPDRPDTPGSAGGYTDPRDRADSSSIGQFGGIGLQFAAAIIISVYAGQWLDRRFGTSPAFLLGCMLVFGGGTFYGIYRKLMAAQEREERERAERKQREADARRGEDPRP